MRTRCSNVNCSDYPNYGGKGITICDRWESFRNFLADMSERPEGFTLERIDNDGNYSPENCKWATRKEQSRNRSHNRIIEYQGERKTLVEWAEANRMTLATLRQRLLKGWPLKTALSQHVQTMVKLDAEKVRTIRTSGKRVIDLAAEYGVDRTVVSRIKHGHTWKHIQ